MEFVPVLIPTGTKPLRVLYKYFIVFQQQIPDAQMPGGHLLAWAGRPLGWK